MFKDQQIRIRLKNYFQKQGRLCEISCSYVDESEDNSTFF